MVRHKKLKGADNVVEESKNNNWGAKKTIILSAALLLLVLSLIGLYAYNQLNKISHFPIDKSDQALGIQTEPERELQSQADLPLNIALFGIDQWNKDEAGRSDIIMIVSIDKKNNKIKLSSIMRDTYVNIPGRGMDKINHAYDFGGPQLALSTINSNFNMDIKDFASVDISSMEKIVDYLGGIDIYLLPEELPKIKGITTAGLQHLNGKQAIAYARIRKIGNADYQRTQRQRDALTQIIDKVQAAGPQKLPELVSTMLPYVTTSYNKLDLLKIGSEVFTSNSAPVEQARFPLDSACYGATINGIYYLVADLNINTNALHDFIYNDIKRE